MSWSSGFSNKDFARIPCNQWLSGSLGCWVRGFGTILTVTTFVTVYGDIVKVTPLFIVGFLIV